MCVCVPARVYRQRYEHAHVRLSRLSYIIMHAHLSHGCTEFGQKKRPCPPPPLALALTSTPLPPLLLSKSVSWEMSTFLISRYVVHCSCLLIEKSLAVTSSTSSSSSLLFSVPRPSPLHPSPGLYIFAVGHMTLCHSMSQDVQSGARFTLPAWPSYWSEV